PPRPFVAGVLLSVKVIYFTTEGCCKPRAIFRTASARASLSTTREAAQATRECRRKHGGKVPPMQAAEKRGRKNCVNCPNSVETPHDVLTGRSKQDQD